MSLKVRGKKLDTINISAVITVSVLVITTTLLFLAFPFFGILGLYDVIQQLNLARVNFFDGIFSNLIYFGFFFFLIYIISALLDITSKILAHLNHFQFSKKTMTLNYLIQIVICSILFKTIVDHYFLRIDIAFIGLLILFSVLYAVYYVMLDANETID